MGELQWRTQAHGWIGADGGPVGDFLCLVCALSYICFAAFVDASFLSIGHSLRAPSCMTIDK